VSDAAAISLRDVGKQYRLPTDRREQLLHHLRPRRSVRELWALQDVSFDVQPGETIGVIGRNGSGKTTLLRVISGVTAPSTGHVLVRGRLAPLIGIGVGFNQELTGRENVVVNARLLGLSPAQIRRRFDDIVEFSEIESFIDSPVKVYSSGMFLRLAFAVAIHTDPEIFVLDELLAVGDLAFQLKCMERMREIQQAGTTIVIVTHNLHTLDRIAPRAVLLSGGRVVFDGPTEAAIGEMHAVLRAEARERLSGHAGADASGMAEVALDILDARGQPRRNFDHGEPLTLAVSATFAAPADNALLGLMVAPLGLATPIYTTFMVPGGRRRRYDPDRPLEAQITLEAALLAGGYSVSVGLYDENGQTMLGRTLPETFYVSSREIQAGGFVDLRAEFVVDGKPVRRAPARRLGSSRQAR
jgi:ABC-type polysaccharide/polyol phosphate transport system ATPase subunit